MNEELKKKVNEFLMNSVEGLEFLRGEIPEIIQELLDWYFFCSLSMFVAITSIFVVLAVSFFKYAKNLDQEDVAAGIFYVTAMILVPFFIIAISDCVDWIKIMCAPKLYILEYIRNF